MKADNLQKNTGLNANTLKLIAVIAMVVQHATIVFYPTENALHWTLYAVGRITAPVMCFMIVEGYYHTSNIKKYLMRLFIATLISHVPHALAFGYSPYEFWKVTSIMWCLFLGLLALVIFNKKEIPLILRLLGVGICCILSFPGNLNCIIVLWIMAFGVFRDSNRKKYTAFFIVTLCYLAEFWVISSHGIPWIRLVSLLAIPLLMMYNGMLGKKSKWIQYGYYLFYPLHLLVLYGLKMLIG